MVLEQVNRRLIISTYCYIFAKNHATMLHENRIGAHKKRGSPPGCCKMLHGSFRRPGHLPGTSGAKRMIHDTLSPMSDVKIGLIGGSGLGAVSERRRKAQA